MEASRKAEEEALSGNLKFTDYYNNYAYSFGLHVHI